MQSDKTKYTMPVHGRLYTLDNTPTQPDKWLAWAEHTKTGRTGTKPTGCLQQVTLQSSRAATHTHTSGYTA